MLWPERCAAHADWTEADMSPAASRAEDQPLRTMVWIRIATSTTVASQGISAPHPPSHLHIFDHSLSHPLSRIHIFSVLPRFGDHNPWICNCFRCLGTGGGRVPGGLAFPLCLSFAFFLRTGTYSIMRLSLPSPAWEC
jgi:hypothetical protein